MDTFGELFHSNETGLWETLNQVCLSVGMKGSIVGRLLRLLPLSPPTPRQWAYLPLALSIDSGGEGRGPKTASSHSPVEEAPSGGSVLSLSWGQPGCVFSNSGNRGKKVLTLCKHWHPQNLLPPEREIKEATGLSRMFICSAELQIQEPWKSLVVPVQFRKCEGITQRWASEAAQKSHLELTISKWRKTCDRPLFDGTKAISVGSEPFFLKGEARKKIGKEKGALDFWRGEAGWVFDSVGVGK